MGSDRRWRIIFMKTTNTNKAMKTMEQLRKTQETIASEIARLTEMKKDIDSALAVYGVEVTNEIVYEQPQTIININKGKIVEVQVTNEEELNRLYEENARHIRRINELAAENEKLIDETIELENQIAFKDGQITGLQRRIKELETKEAKATKVKAMQDELKEYKEQITKDNERLEAYVQNVVNKQPTNDLKDKLAKIKAVQERQEKINNMTPDEIHEYLKPSDKAVERAEQVKREKQELIDKYELTYKAVNYKENMETVYCVFGTIKLAGKTFSYKATNLHDNPIVFGCMDMNLIRETRDVLTKLMSFGFATTEKEGYDNVVYDFANDIVIWKTHDNQYKGYTSQYVFVWDGITSTPCRKALKSALNNKVAMKPMTTATTSEKQFELGQRIIALCKEHFDKHEEFTNEVVVNTNDELDLDDITDEEIDL
jgi:hypothetical protein